MGRKILFIHTIANTPYKHYYYNLLSKYFEVHVIQLAHYSKIRNWESIEDKKYSEYVIFHGYINYRKKLQSVFKIVKLIRQINPAMIIAHGYHRIEFLLVPWFFKKRILACETATTFSDRTRVYWKERIKSLVLNKTFHYFFTYGSASKNYLVQDLGINPEKVFVKGNFSHLQLQKYTQNEFSKREKRILFVGRFAEEKNIFTLIDAFTVFEQKNKSGYTLTLVGTGELKGKITGYVKSLNIASQIEFVAYQNSDELVSYYQNSKLFVLPSFSEPWGQVINEAMYFALPIVISKNCGSAEDLCKENARKFDPKSKDELIAIFNELLNNESELERMSKASLSLIKNFKPALLIEKQVAFLNDILVQSTEN